MLKLIIVDGGKTTEILANDWKDLEAKFKQITKKVVSNGSN